MHGIVSSGLLNKRPALELSDVLTGVGIALCVGMVGLSTILNFRMGYRFADTELDGWIYGGVGALTDGFKALTPFFMMLSWRKGYRIPAVVGGLIFAVFTAFSFTAEVGYASQHRMAKAASRVTGEDRYKDLRRQLERAESGLKQLGPQRASAAIEQARKAILKEQVGESRRTVDEISLGCVLNRKEAREACTRWQTLGIEAATAAQAEALEKQAELDSEIPGQRHGHRWQRHQRPAGSCTLQDGKLVPGGV